MMPDFDDDLIKRPPLPHEFYLQDTLEATQRIIGHILLHETPDGIIAGRIIEAEAYLINDPANHSTRGMTHRNRIVFGPPGHVYDYMIHTHWVMAVVTQPECVPELIHLRSLEPLAGIDLMIQARGTDEITNLCKGPGNLTKALRIDGSLYGTDIVTGKLRVVQGEEITNLVQTTRVGIKQAADKPWRFYSADHRRWVSKPR